MSLGVHPFLFDLFMSVHFMAVTDEGVGRMCDLMDQSQLSCDPRVTGVDNLSASFGQLNGSSEHEPSEQSRQMNLGDGMTFGSPALGRTKNCREVPT